MHSNGGASALICSLSIERALVSLRFYISVCMHSILTKIGVVRHTIKIKINNMEFADVTSMWAHTLHSPKLLSILKPGSQYDAGHCVASRQF